MAGFSVALVGTSYGIFSLLKVSGGLYFASQMFLALHFRLVILAYNFKQGKPS